MAYPEPYICCYPTCPFFQDGGTPEAKITMGSLIFDVPQSVTRLVATECYLASRAGLCDYRWGRGGYRKMWTAPGLRSRINEGKSRGKGYDCHALAWLLTLRPLCCKRESDCSFPLLEDPRSDARNQTHRRTDSLHCCCCCCICYCLSPDLINAHCENTRKFILIKTK